MCTRAGIETSVGTEPSSACGTPESPNFERVIALPPVEIPFWTKSELDQKKNAGTATVNAATLVPVWGAASHVKIISPKNWARWRVSPFEDSTRSLDDSKLTDF